MIVNYSKEKKDFCGTQNKRARVRVTGRNMQCYSLYEIALVWILSSAKLLNIAPYGRTMFIARYVYINWKKKALLNDALLLL